MNEITSQPERIFIVHGEKEGAEALLQAINETYGWDAQIPQLYDIEEL